MTNDQHITNLKKLRSILNGSYGKSINAAIKALEFDMTTYLEEHNYVLWDKDCSEAAEKALEQPKTGWIPVSERLPELNKPLLVTAYHRVCYAHMISKSGNYGYPVFRLHEIKDSDRGWVQETISHEPFSKGRIDAWMYIDIPEPYKAESKG